MSVCLYLCIFVGIFLPICVFERAKCQCLCVCELIILSGVLYLLCVTVLFKCIVYFCCKVCLLGSMRVFYVSMFVICVV